MLCHWLRCNIGHIELWHSASSWRSWREWCGLEVISFFAAPDLWSIYRKFTFPRLNGRGVNIIYLYLNLVVWVVRAFGLKQRTKRKTAFLMTKLKWLKMVTTTEAHCIIKWSKRLLCFSVEKCWWYNKKNWQQLLKSLAVCLLQNWFLKSFYWFVELLMVLVLPVYQTCFYP